MERDGKFIPDAWHAHKWIAEAKRWAKHLYAYEEMIDDGLEFFHERYKAGDDPADAVEKFAGQYGVVRALR